MSSKPENFPNSDEIYKDEQTGPDSFLESETTWMSFNESKEYVRPLNFENFQIEGDELGQEDIFTNAEKEISLREEDVEI